jgi:hypothetical protein
LTGAFGGAKDDAALYGVSRSGAMWIIGPNPR